MKMEQTQKRKWRHNVRNQVDQQFKRTGLKKQDSGEEAGGKRSVVLNFFQPDF